MIPRKLLAVAAIAVSLPALSNAALTFDLNESPSYGYSTRDVTSIDAIGNGGSDTGIGTTVTVIPNAAPTNTQIRFQTTVSLGQFAQGFADLTITNMSTLNGYLDSLNEFYINYTVADSSSANVVSTISLLWRGPTDAGFTTGINSLDFDENRDQFQGEDIYAAGGSAPPLLANGQTGTLRFLFGASPIAPGAQTVDFTIGGMSLTAVVPEPSSALFLSGVLGLFGTTFRRRRKLAGA